MSIQLGTAIANATHIRVGTAQREVHNVYYQKDGRLEYIWGLPALPSVVSFSVTPTHIPASQNVDSSTIRLDWNTTGATRTSVKDPTGFEVGAGQGSGAEGVDISAPGVDQVYTLEAINSTGTTRQFLHFSVACLPLSVLSEYSVAVQQHKALVLLYIQS